MNYFFELLRDTYEKVRKFTPIYKTVQYSGWEIGTDRHLLDGLIPGFRHLTSIQDYEYRTIQAQRQNLVLGDKVVIIGGGYGATACNAANLVGDSGKVTVFEANLLNAKITKETCKNNGFAKRVEVVEAIVSRDIGVYPGESSANIVKSKDLPDCDVLELDCEGSEQYIIDEMLIRPNTIIVETHGSSGAPSIEVERKLQKLGYETYNLGIAEPRARELCDKYDIKLIVAKTRKVRSKKNETIY